MHGIASDLANASRSLLRRPGFSALVVLTLAIGIGASTAIFSVVDGVLLRGLPYPEADRLIRVRTQFQGRISNSNAAANFLDYREQIAGIESVTTYQYRRWHLGDTPEPRFLLGVEASHEFFTVVGVKPDLGRGFAADDERADADVAVISYGFWQSHFGGRPDVIGQQVTLDSQPYTVIGVMPSGFGFPYFEVEVWRPLWFDVTAPGLRTDHLYSVIARIADGVSLTEVQREFSAYGERVIREYPENYKDFQYGCSAVSLHESMVGSARTPLLVLFAGVTCVLLIAVANVSNLLLVRSESRSHELAVRSALGASRPRIARQLLAECLVLAAGGGTIGLLIAVAGLRILLTLAGDEVPRVDNVHVDLRVLAFAAGISIAAGLMVGILPAIRMSARRPGQTLQSGGRAVVAGGRSLVRSALVSGEVALAVMLVIGAGLMIRTLAELRRVDVGFRTEGVVTARVRLPLSRYTEGPRVVEYFRTLQERVESLPGVRSVGIVWQLPLDSGFGTYSIQIEGREVDTVGESPHTYLQLCSPGYFDVLGLEPVTGRLLDDNDIAGRPPVAVANQAFMRQLLDGEPAVGRRVRQWGDDTPWFEIVGTVPDILQRSLEREPYPTLYVTHAQLGIEGLPSDFYLLRAARNMALVVHVDGDATALVEALRELVRQIDPLVPITGVRTMADIRAGAQADRQFPTVLLVVFGCVALMLATVGVYGVVAYSAGTRAHEIGVRMALGAGRSDVRRMMLRQGLLPVAIGVLLGLAGAAATARLFKSLLFEVAPTDPTTLLAVPLLISAAAAAASFIPALRASRVDPVSVLRSE